MGLEVSCNRRTGKELSTKVERTDSTKNARHINTLEMLALFNLHLHKVASNKVKVMREFPAESLAKEY